MRALMRLEWVRALLVAELLVALAGIVLTSLVALVLGYVTPDNTLVISGRITSVINVGGEKVNPEKVEEVLSTHPQVQQVAALALPNEQGLNEVCALIVPRKGPTLATGLIKSFCEDRLPAHFVPSRIILVKSLPKNEMGKVNRQMLPDLVKNMQN
mgnify:CR=1 FL=1